MGSVRSRHSLTGFTLLEVMVVVMVIGIVLAGVQLVLPSHRPHLREDAERLAALLAAAHSEVRADGRPIRWVPSAQGYHFERAARRWVEGEPLPTTLAQGRPELLPHDSPWRLRQWQEGPVQVRLDPPGPLLLTAEWIHPQQRIELQHDSQRLIVRRRPDGHYVVE